MVRVAALEELSMEPETRSGNPDDLWSSSIDHDAGGAARVLLLPVHIGSSSVAAVVGAGDGEPLPHRL